MAVTLATFAQNTALGLAANSALDALSLPEFSNRAPVPVGRTDIVFDGTAFVLVPPDESPVNPPSEPPTD